jgi:hypothetical protein
MLIVAGRFLELSANSPVLKPYRAVKSTVDPSCVTYRTVPTLGTKYRSDTLEPPVLVVTLERMRNANEWVATYTKSEGP